MQEEIYEKKVKFSAKVRSRINADVHREHACELREALERQQKASNNILAESGESIIKNGKNKTNYSQNLTEKDFTNAALIEKQLSELDRIEQGENISVGYDLTAEETKTAREEFDNYVKEENLLGHGKIHKQRESNDAMFDANVNRTIENRQQLQGEEARHRVEKPAPKPKKNKRNKRNTPPVTPSAPTNTPTNTPENNASGNQPSGNSNNGAQNGTPNNGTSDSGAGTATGSSSNNTPPAGGNSNGASSNNGSGGSSSGSNNKPNETSSANSSKNGTVEQDDSYNDSPASEHKPPIKFVKPTNTPDSKSANKSTKPVDKPAESKPVDKPTNKQPSAEQVESKPKDKRAERRSKNNKPEDRVEPNIESTTTSDDYNISIDTHQPITREVLENNSPGMQTEKPLSRREERRQARQKKKLEREQRKEPHIPSTNRIDVGTTDQYKLNNKPIDLGNSAVSSESNSQE